jgi:hypothetical protein
MEDELQRVAMGSANLQQKTEAKYVVEIFKELDELG